MSFACKIHQARFVRHRTTLELRPSALFRAWTDPAAKARWFNGPADKWTEQVREMDVRVGGRERVIGKFADGSESRFEAAVLRHRARPAPRLHLRHVLPGQEDLRVTRQRGVRDERQGRQPRHETHRDRAARVSRWLRRRRQPRTRHARAHGQPGNGAWRRRLARAAQEPNADRGTANPRRPRRRSSR